MEHRPIEEERFSALERLSGVFDHRAERCAIDVALARRECATAKGWIPRLVEGIAREAYGAGTDAFLLGVPSRSVALAAVDAGIRY